MTKYKVTIAATSYHQVECDCDNEDQAEREAVKKFDWNAFKPIGDIDYEAIEIQTVES